MEGNKEGDERVVLSHEAKSNGARGLFGIELNDGKRIKILAEENTLLRDTQYFDGEQWCHEESEEVDVFYLTGPVGEEYIFQMEDIFKIFDVDDYYDWGWESLSGDDYEENDSNELRKKKWDDYKSSFPKLTSKEQVRFMNDESSND